MPSCSSPTATWTWTTRRRPTCCHSSAMTARASSASIAPRSRSSSWPEYGKMIGGYFDGHPWGEFDAPLVVEDAEFPGHGASCPADFTLKDEIYQIKNFSRDNVRVLLRLDASKVDLSKKGVTSQGQGFRGHLGAPVRQRARPLQRPGASRGGLGSARYPEDVAGEGAMVDGAHPGRCHAAEPQPAE